MRQDGDDDHGDEDVLSKIVDIKQGTEPHSPTRQGGLRPGPKDQNDGGNDNESEEGNAADDEVQGLRISSMTKTVCVHDCTHRWVLAQQRRHNGDDNDTGDSKSDLRTTSVTSTMCVRVGTHRWVHFLQPTAKITKVGQ